MTGENALGRNGRSLLLVAFIIAVLWLLYTQGNAIMPFVVGLLLAYLLLPMVDWVEKRLPYLGRWPQTRRAISILLVFLLFALAAALFIFYVGTAIVNSGQHLLNNAPQIISQSLDSLGLLKEAIKILLPLAMRDQFDTAAAGLGATVANSIGGFFVNAIPGIAATATLVLGFITMPIFLFYILKDSARLSKNILSAMPPQAALHTRAVMGIVVNVLGRYIRVQVVLSLAVAVVDLIGLLLLGIGYNEAMALAAFAGLSQNIPLVGPILSTVAAVVVVLAQAPQNAVWVGILFIGSQTAENMFLVPRIQSSFFNMHPALVMFLLVIGGAVAGFWGLILVVPVAATFARIYQYFRQSGQVGFGANPPEA